MTEPPTSVSLTTSATVTSTVQYSDFCLQVLMLNPTHPSPHRMLCSFQKT